MMKENLFKQIYDKPKRQISETVKLVGMVRREFHLVDNPDAVFQIAQLTPQQINIHYELLQAKHKQLNLQNRRKPERSFYAKLEQQINFGEKFINQINDIKYSEVFEFQQIFITFYLKEFLQIVRNQCSEKANLLTKLWNSLINVFNQLIQRICKEKAIKEKQHLSQSIKIHQEYQENIKNLKEKNQKLEQKNEKSYQLVHMLIDHLRENKNKLKQMKGGINYCSSQINSIKDKYAYLRNQHIDLLVHGHPTSITREEAEYLLSQREDFTETLHQTYSFPKGILKKKKQLSKQSIKSNSQLIIHKFQKQGDKFQLDEVICEEDDLNQKTIFENQFQMPIIEFTQPLIKHISIQTANVASTNSSSFGQNLGFIQKIQDNFIKNRYTQVQFTSLISTETQTKQYQFLKQTKSKPQINLFDAFTSIKTVDADGFFDDIKDSSNQNKQKLENEQVMNKQIMYFQALKQAGIRKPQNAPLQWLTPFAALKQDVRKKHLKKQKNKIQNQIENIGLSNKKFHQRSMTGIKSKVFFPSEIDKRQKQQRKFLRKKVSKARLKTQNQNEIKKQRIQKLTHPKRLSQSPQIINFEEKIIKLDNNRKNNILQYLVLSHNDEAKEKIVERQYKKIHIKFLLKEINMSEGKVAFIDSVIKKLLQHHKINQQKYQSPANHKGQDLNLYLVNSQLRQFFKRGIKKDRRRSNMIFGIKFIMKKISQIYKIASFIVRKQQYCVNFIDLLRQDIQRELGKLKKQQIQHKMHNLIEAFNLHYKSSYMIQNFIFFTAICEKLHYSNILFSSDVVFYIQLLDHLNCQSNETQDYQKAFTTVQKLQSVIHQFIIPYYPFQQLIVSIRQSVASVLKPNIDSQTKLDIYKCCYLVIMEVMKAKSSIIKSYQNIMTISMTSKQCVDEDFFNELMKFLVITKVRQIQLHTKFKRACGKGPILVQNLASFCLKQKIPEFQKLPFANATAFNYKISQDITLCDDLHFTLIKFNAKNNLGTICDFLLKDKNQLLLPKNHSVALVSFVIAEKQSSLLIQQILGQNLVNIYTMAIYLLQQSV